MPKHQDGGRRTAPNRLISEPRGYLERPHPPVRILEGSLSETPLVSRACRPPFPNHRDDQADNKPLSFPWIVAMTPIHTLVLSSKLEAPLFSRPCLLPTASHSHRPTVRAGYLACRGGFWSSSPFRMSQSGPKLRGKLRRPLHVVAQMI